MQSSVVSHPFISNNPSLRGFLEHPAGPFTIHFWAPTAKWFISAANIADYNRPVEKMSKPQQAGAHRLPSCTGSPLPDARRRPLPARRSPPRYPPFPAAVAGTGVIWARYSTQIIPLNYNLLAVNAVMACTGFYHLAR